MPFKSKAQMRAGFVSGGFSGKIDPKQWAAETPNKKKLLERVKPKAKKKPKPKKKRPVVYKDLNYPEE